MNSYVQVLSFVVSFINGLVFYLLSYANKVMISNKNNVVKLLITLVFVIDVVILYIYIMYKINYGMIHPYFVAVVFLGYVVMMFLYDKCVSLLKKLIKKIKRPL